MSKIISIATSLPAFKHSQDDLFSFADKVYSKNESDSRKLKFLYRQSGISNRYSVIPDYSSAGDAEQNRFYDAHDMNNSFPGIEKRMEWYNHHAVGISVEAIEKCIEGKIEKDEITHLITVSCTGMSAPGLDLQVMENMQLPANIIRSSVNFMGCYAAIHAIKLADAFCKADKKANVVIICTELCTLHFQKEISTDNITSSLLFGDGAAALLMQNSHSKHRGIQLTNFYSEVSFKGKKEMAWEISSTGFLMTLTGFVPGLIKEDFDKLVAKALQSSGKSKEEVTHWCIHPGGKKILESIETSLNISHEQLAYAYQVLDEYGNMSSPTVLFVLQKIFEECNANAAMKAPLIFAAAFGPGLTMGTFTATYA